jgi:hypothetical protein
MNFASECITLPQMLSNPVLYNARHAIENFDRISVDPA